MSTITICCIILSIIFIIIDLIKEEYGWVFVWICVLDVNIYAGILQRNEKENGAGEGVTETYVIKDVKGFKADTITIINGVDTTKTYTLTYWK